MLYLFLGLILGILLSIAPVWTPSGAMEIYPEWHGSIDSIRNIDETANPALSKINLHLTSMSDLYLLSAKGQLLKQINFGNHLVSVSSSGKYYAQFDKIGTHVEFLNSAGDRFWRIKSMEYPYITSNGKIILLLNGDQSKVRIMNINGNPTGAKEIYGTLCTAISLSKNTDYSAIGFLDGSYFLLNENGDVLNRGTTPDNSIVKGISISINGKYFVIHYGDNKKDFLRLVDSGRDKSYTIQLKNVHTTRTALNVNDKGNIAVIDFDRIIISHYDKIESIIKIPPKSPGVSSIDVISNIFLTCYKSINGKTNFFIFLDDGTLLFRKSFSDDTFIESRLIENIIFLRGSSNLYCYSLLLPDSQ